MASSHYSHSEKRHSPEDQIIQPVYPADEQHSTDPLSVSPRILTNSADCTDTSADHSPPQETINFSPLQKSCSWYCLAAAILVLIE